MKTWWVRLPMVSTMTVHSDDELTDLYENAGFTDVTVTTESRFEQISRGFRPGGPPARDCG